MLRVSFSNMTAARAAMNVLEAYGYSAKQFGRDVVSDCPTLLAVPAIQKSVGLANIERLDLGRPKSLPESTAEVYPSTGATRPERAHGLTA